MSNDDIKYVQASAWVSLLRALQENEDLGEVEYRRQVGEGLIVNQELVAALHLSKKAVEGIIADLPEGKYRHLRGLCEATLAECDVRLKLAMSQVRRGLAILADKDVLDFADDLEHARYMAKLTNNEVN